LGPLKRYFSSTIIFLLLFDQNKIRNPTSVKLRLGNKVKRENVLDGQISSVPSIARSISNT